MVNGEWACEGIRTEVRAARLEVHQLEPDRVGWHVSAEPKEDGAQRLLISGTALPLTSMAANALTPQFVDSPNPLVLSGERAMLVATGGVLWLTRHSHLRGSIACLWRERPVELVLEFDVELHVM